MGILGHKKGMGGRRGIVRKPRKRRRKGPLTLAKEKLWAVTRLLVFKTYGSDCFTCPRKNLKGSDRHGGHVPWASSELSTPCRYDVRYIRAQCYDCNMNKNGCGAEAFKKMVLQGIDVDLMWNLNKEMKGKVYTLEQVKALTESYKQLLNERGANESPPSGD